MYKIFPRSYLLLTLLVLSKVTIGQSPDFIWAKGQEFNVTTTANLHFPHPVITSDLNNGALAVGFETITGKINFSSIGSIQMNHYLNDGTGDWSRILQGNAHAIQLDCAPNGNYYLLGRYLDSLDLGNSYSFSSTSNTPHYFLASFDESGNTNWAIDIHNDLSVTGRAEEMAIDQYSNAYLTAINGNLLYILKIDSTGFPVIFTTQSHLKVSSIDVDSLGYVYLTGNCIDTSGAIFGGVQYDSSAVGTGYNRYVLRYKPDGTLSWIKLIRLNGCSHSQVSVDGIDALYWTGQLFEGAIFDSTLIPGPYFGWPIFFIARLDSGGNYLWITESPTSYTSGNFLDSHYVAEVNTSGSITIVGHQFGDVNWISGMTTTNGGSVDPFIVQYNRTGNPVWAKIANGKQVDYGQSLSIAPDGSVYISGTTYDTLHFDSITVISPGKTSLFFARLSFLPAVPAGLELKEPLDNFKDDITIYPNPVRDQLFISSETMLRSVKIIDLTGRVLMETNGGNKISLDVSTLPQGPYLVFTQDNLGDNKHHLIVKQ